MELCFPLIILYVFIKCNRVAFAPDFVITKDYSWLQCPKCKPAQFISHKDHVRRLVFQGDHFQHWDIAHEVMFAKKRYGGTNNLVNLNMIEVWKHQSFLVGAIMDEIEKERRMSLGMRVDLRVMIICVWLFHAGNYISIIFNKWIISNEMNRTL